MKNIFTIVIFTRSVILGKAPTCRFLIRQVGLEHVKISFVQESQLIVEEMLSFSAVQSQIVN